MTFTFKYKRKIIVYALTISVMLGSAFVMDINKYQPFLQYVTFLSIAFFSGNALEHLSGAIKNKSEK